MKTPSTREMARRGRPSPSITAIRRPLPLVGTALPAAVAKASWGRAGPSVAAYASCPSASAVTAGLRRRVERAGLVMQVLYSVRSERHLMEQINYNLLFRRLVGLVIDDPV